MASLAPVLVKSLKNRVADKSPEVRCRAAQLLACINRGFADYATQETRVSLAVKLLEDVSDAVR
jgi:hypothetical protein